MCYIIVAVILKTNVGYEEEAAQSPQKKKIATDVYIQAHKPIYANIIDGQTGYGRVGAQNFPFSFYSRLIFQK